jgi:hypothetical protein
MANTYFVVQVNAVPGEEVELNRWYEEQHLDDCLACDTAIAAQRFRKVQGSGPGNYAYLVLYEVGDPQGFAENRRSKEGTPLLPRTPALALPAHAFFYRPTPEQADLLASPDRTPFYIEFLDAGEGEGGNDRLIERKKAVAAVPGVAACELMLVDVYQERQGWHADGIVFAQLAHGAGNFSPSALAAPSGGTLRVAEAGIYEPVSVRKIRA